MVSYQGPGCNHYVWMQPWSHLWMHPDMCDVTPMDASMHSSILAFFGLFMACFTASEGSRMMVLFFLFWGMLYL